MLCLYININNNLLEEGEYYKILKNFLLISDGLGYWHAGSKLVRVLDMLPWDGLDKCMVIVQLLCIYQNVLVLA